MGKLIFSNSYTVATDDQITMRTNNAAYPKLNVMDLWHPARNARAGDVTDNDWLMKFDFGAATTISAIVLNDVNFDNVTIQGHASDAWGAPTFTSSTAVTQDVIVSRYKLFLPLTAFSYRWLRIFIPTGAVEVGTSISEWSIGSIMLITEHTELTRNMAYGYKLTSERAYEDIRFGHGGTERANLGDRLKALITIVFKIRSSDDEGELWTFNAVDSNKPMSIYENNGITSRVYVSLRDRGYESKLVQHNQVLGNTIKFEELV